MLNKPENKAEYFKWLKEYHGVTIEPKHARNYESVTNKIRRDFEELTFWKHFKENISSYNSEYFIQTGYNLFVDLKPPEILIKKFENFVDKTYRKNILENRKWPAEPQRGWVLPQNWFSQINDIVRTMITVKYLDGVEFLINKFQDFFLTNGIQFHKFYEAREEGYYAVHLYMECEFEIENLEWDTQKTIVRIEFQITTQLQEVIKTLTHKYYEKRRNMLRKDSEKWQWKYDSEEFTANYLGHILHYIEGMIMEIRNKQKEK